MPKQNKGEIGETQCIKHCFKNRNNSQWCMDNFDEPERIEIINPKTRQVITSEDEIQKASASYKADCMIRKCTSGKIKSPSIKSSNCAPPAILNHTPRTANAFQNELVEYLPAIDKTLEFYLEKRRRHECGEDVFLRELLNEANAQDEEKRAWLRVISYFAFNGTGGSRSRCPADSILIWDGETITFHDCETDTEKDNYIHNLMSKGLLKISLRGKGMPPIPTNENLPWLFEDYKDDGTVKLKGSLHIRQVKQ